MRNGRLSLGKIVINLKNDYANYLRFLLVIYRFTEVFVNSCGKLSFQPFLKNKKVNYLYLGLPMDLFLIMFLNSKKNFKIIFLSSIFFNSNFFI